MNRPARRLTAGLLVIAAALVASAWLLAPGARAATLDPVTVSITDNAGNCPNGKPCYHPSQVSIQVNQAVTWTNESSKTHTVTCTSAPPGVACNGDSGPQSSSGFGENTGLAKNGGTYTYQFTTPGTYLYHSKNDGSTLVGEVDVSAGGPVTFSIGTPAPTPAPTATPTPTPSPSDSTSPSALAVATPSGSASPTPTDSAPIGVAPSSSGGGFPVIPVALIILVAAGAAGGAFYLNRRG